MQLRSLAMGLLFFVLGYGVVYAGQGKTYVGSKACAECHEKEYQNWSKYAKKAHSYEAIQKMRHDLTAEEMSRCYGCHTTGYGTPSGFKDAQSTPDLKEVGCEACHGPGSGHVESNDPSDIKSKLSMKDCERCHTTERVNAFYFKPLVHAGAH